MSKTCAEVAAEFIKNNEKNLNEWICHRHWIEKFKECSDFPKPKKKKQVWQWRYRACANWSISPILMTEDDVTKDEFTKNDGVVWEKHAGPFEVEG